MAEHIVGTWNQFTFKIATLSNEVEIIKHLREYFLNSEAMNVYLGWEDENAQNYSAMVGIALKHGCSFLIRETSTGEVNNC